MNKRSRSEALGFAGATMVAAGSVIGSLFLLVTMLQASWPVFVVGVIVAGSMLFIGLSEIRQPGVLIGRTENFLNRRK
jgi:hypothetical protein